MLEAASRAVAAGTTQRCNCGGRGCDRRRKSDGRRHEPK